MIAIMILHCIMNNASYFYSPKFILQCRKYLFAVVYFPAYEQAIAFCNNTCFDLMN